MFGASSGPTRCRGSENKSTRSRSAPAKGALGPRVLSNNVQKVPRNPEDAKSQGVEIVKLETIFRKLTFDNFKTALQRRIKKTILSRQHQYLAPST